MTNQEIRTNHFVEDSFVYSMQHLVMGARIGAALIQPVMREVRPILGYYANEKKAKLMQGVIFEARTLRKALFPRPEITIL